MKEIRLLKADEIELRVNTINEKGVTLLLYKDARCDMNILDETFGIFGWQRHHVRDNANCIISIWDDEKKQWIEKEDTGTESFTEKEKGLASDSFKRAGFNVGIGRELYTAPFIWVPSSKTEIKKGNNGKLTTFDKFIVAEITYTDKRTIDGLKIVNQNGEVVFEKYPKQKEKKTTQKQEEAICTDCGKPVNSAMATRTKKAFGTVLCKECGLRRSKADE